MGPTSPGLTGRVFVLAAAAHLHYEGKALTGRDLASRLRVPLGCLNATYRPGAGFWRERAPGRTGRVPRVLLPAADLETAVGWLAADLGAVVPDPADRRDLLALLGRKLGVAVAFYVPSEDLAGGRHDADTGVPDNRRGRRPRRHR